ncbi:translation initiation factor 3 subunit E [Fistulifera solaris]|uniref:Eukaryotic translation initiation factor 3 subunit E n=1 Tax=Fistulifera solaris TaxID=1519565 RepID=A0A1Z5KCX1_FISSO|nr:translation initiation factor 3 subunit E [Fistulifera solaris]|eukprot:GAX24160.1 translation initiation factor 3 subunit E [Fistulifera solaris]
MTAHSTESTAEQWDLTAQVSPYLDRHLIFPLLEYIIENLDYSKDDVAAARLELLRPTHMVDYAAECHKALHGDAPAEMKQQKEQVYQQLETLKNGCEPLLKLCQDENGKKKLVESGKWNVAGLTQLPETTSEMIQTYLALARFHFDCGDYKSSRDMLTHYISWHASPPATSAEDEEEDLVLAGVQQSKHQQQAQNNPDLGNPSMYYLKKVDKDMLQVLWGKLACEILVEDWTAARTALDAVKTAMETLTQMNQISALEALQQRTWLLHWSLFVYWNGPGGLEQLVDLCMTEKYKQAITTNAPHLLRYLTAAVLLCKRRVTSKTVEARRLMKQLVYVLQDCEYTDPIVEFVNCLCVKYDFDAAQVKLQECEKVLRADFFLCQQTAVFMEEARIFVFENYCRIHHKIDLQALGDKLAMAPAEAERWMVDLIRNATDMDACLQDDCVVMNSSRQSIYEQVMERTKDLNVRSATLSQSLNTLWNEARKEKLKREKAVMED